MQQHQNVYNQIEKQRSEGRKSLAVLIDPDHLEHLSEVLSGCEDAGVDFIFLGGSLLSKGEVDDAIYRIKEVTKIPVLLFPADELQIHPAADAILLLSLISGRNAELLIGKHVVAAPYLKRSKLEILSTGYMLVDGGKLTTASYISASLPLPADKPEIAACTAMAGEMLGLKLLYLDAGSGALNPVSAAIIKSVKKHTNAPLIVGGGIRNAQAASIAWKAGADIVVVGNAIEQNSELLHELKQTKTSLHHLTITEHTQG